MNSLVLPDHQAPQISPEIELLLCCARTQLSTEAYHNIQRLLSHPIDWRTFLRAAKRHGVLPLICHTFNTIDPKILPADILGQLRSHAYATALHNTRLTQELITLLGLFKTKGIAAIAFKGPILAASVYQNLGLRQFRDLDILVARRDRPLVHDVLISQGYVLHQDLGWQSHYIHVERYLNIDVHYRITPEFFACPIDFDALYARLEPLSLGGVSVPQLSPEDRLVLLSVLLGKDCCHWDVRLAQLCDVAELLRRFPLQWDQVWLRGHEWGCERLVLLDLCLSQGLLGVDLPKAVTGRLDANPIVQSLATWVHNRLWQRSQPPEEDSLWTFLRSYNHPFYFNVRERPRDKFTYVGTWLRLSLAAGLTPNAVDRAWLPLPQRLSFLYYFLHPLRLLIHRGIQPIYTKLWGVTR